jgi:hypothetical protein
MKKASTLFVFLILIISVAITEPTVTKQPGNPLKFNLGYSVFLNEDSSLLTEWIAIHDTSILADFTGTPGIFLSYEASSKYSSGGYNYKAKYEITPLEDLTAIEVRFIIFNIWGERESNLSATEVMDLKAGETYPFAPIWRESSESDASEYYASIMYIARTRTKDGKILQANLGAVVEEARKFSSKFNESDLEEK